MGKAQWAAAAREEGGCWACLGSKLNDKTTPFLHQKAEIIAASRVSKFTINGTGKGRVTEEEETPEEE